MRKFPPFAVLLGCVCASATAQTGQGQSSKQYSFQFKADALGRQEWTQNLFPPAEDQDRYLLQARPRIEMGIDWLQIAVGGEFNYGKDENTVPKPVLLRDNYKSREARLDLAFASLKPVDWLQIQGGRMFMPFGLTEMIWDKDLRPQGGAVTFEKKSKAGVRQFALTGLVAQGSHVFEDEKTRMWLASAQFGGGSFSLTGSYIQWDKISEIEPMIRRQNTRSNGAYVYDYKVVDGVLRLTKSGQVNSQIVVDYCWNTAVDQDNKGLWIAVILGSTETAKGKLEYTYAKVDKDATLAAYATDDFFWATGWEGHRGDIGFKVSDHASAHAIGQWQRFKDSPRLLEQDNWVNRWRVELRLRY